MSKSKDGFSHFIYLFPAQSYFFVIFVAVVVSHCITQKTTVRGKKWDRSEGRWVGEREGEREGDASETEVRDKFCSKCFVALSNEG